MAHVSTEPSTATCQDQTYTVTEVDRSAQWESPQLKTGGASLSGICLILIQIISLSQFKSLFLELLILASDLILSL